MSKELAILFIHRGVTPVGYAASNMASAQKSAPDADVISLSFDKDDTGGEVDPKKPYQCWWSPDRLMYYWFRRTQPDYKRYLLCEDDTYFNQHPREFFGPTWDGDAVGGVVVNANLPGLYHDGFVTHKYWCGVEAERSGLMPYWTSLRGFISCFGLFSHRALAKMVPLYFDTPWLKKPNAESTLATLANIAGYDPVSFAPNTHYAAAYIWPAPEKFPDNLPKEWPYSRQGIWHPVKHVVT